MDSDFHFPPVPWRFSDAGRFASLEVVAGGDTAGQVWRGGCEMSAHSATSGHVPTSGLLVAVLLSPETKGKVLLKLGSDYCCRTVPLASIHPQRLESWCWCSSAYMMEANALD
jgi:hypothetical protein